MEEKTFSAKTRNKIYTAIAWAGVAITMAGYFMDGILKPILTWGGLGVVVLAGVFRFTMVKCPYCGNRLTESKTIPDKCPECHKELN